jgi:hypothetical protein
MKSSAERLEKLEKEGELDCKDLPRAGKTPWWFGDGWGNQKTLVCYYRAPNGGIGMAHCREGGTLRLPWNRYAQWS